MSQMLNTSDTTVVAFRSNAARIRRPPATEESRGAILFFTGVRYERVEPEAPKAKRRAKPRPENV